MRGDGRPRLGPTNQPWSAARREPLVPRVESSTELDYTSHLSMAGLGQICHGRGRGLVLHETLALVPEATKDSARLLGVAVLQVVSSTLAEPEAGTPASLWRLQSAREVGRLLVALT